MQRKDRGSWSKSVASKGQIVQDQAGEGFEVCVNSSVEMADKKAPSG